MSHLWPITATENFQESLTFDSKNLRKCVRYATSNSFKENFSRHGASIQGRVGFIDELLL